MWGKKAKRGKCGVYGGSGEGGKGMKGVKSGVMGVIGLSEGWLVMVVKWRNFTCYRVKWRDRSDLNSFSNLVLGRI